MNIGSFELKLEKSSDELKKYLETCLEIACNMSNVFRSFLGQSMVFSAYRFESQTDATHVKCLECPQVYTVL